MKPTQRSTTGWFLYSLILRLIIDGNSTVVELAQKTGVGLKNVRLIVRDLHARKVVHVVDYVPSGERNQPVRSFVYGPGADAPPPVSKRTGITSRHSSLIGRPMRPRAEMTAFLSILRELQSEAGTVPMLAERAGVHGDFLYRLINHLHELKLVRVADFHTPHTKVLCRPVPMYEFAINGQDVKWKPLRRDRTRRRRVIEGYEARDQMLAFTHALAGSANADKFPIAA